MKRIIELNEMDIVEIIAKSLCVCRTDIKISILDADDKSKKKTIKAVIIEDPADWQD